MDIINEYTASHESNIKLNIWLRKGIPSESPNEGVRHKLSATNQKKTKMFGGDPVTLLHILMVVAGHQAYVSMMVMFNI